jgi:hypothetical protein
MAQFTADIKYAVEGRVIKRAQTLVKDHEQATELRQKINQSATLLLNFVKNQLEPQLTLNT